MRKLRSILQYRYTIKILTVVIILLSLINLFFFPKESKYSGLETSIDGYVIDYKIDGDKLTMTLKGDEKVIVNYTFKSESEMNRYKNTLLLGDTLRLEGTMDMVSNNTVPNTFNYKKYLENKSIYYVMNVSNIVKVEQNKSVMYELKNMLIKRIKSIDDSGYLELFLLGNNDNINSEELSNYQVNGISHLFSISGMHISILLGILFFFLDKITYKKYVKYLISDLFLLFYLFLVGFTASITRAVVMFILSSINSCFNLKIKRLDINFLTLDVLLLVNPYIIFEMGFQFSYIISLSLTIFSKKINAISSKFKRNLYISLICFLVSFPISIYYFYQVNFLSILLNLVFIPFVSVVMFPLSFLTLIFPFLEDIFLIGVKIMKESNSFISNINFLQIVFAKPYKIVIILYYFLIYLSFYNKKCIKYLILVMIMHRNIAYFNPNLEILMLDVSQGDSILIRLPFNEGNILIDTGGYTSYEKEKWREKDSNYSIAKSKTIPYLKSVGVDELDFLILTHGDNDHMGEADILVNNFKINGVIFNAGEYNTLEGDLIDVLDDLGVEYFKSPKYIECGGVNFTFLKDKIYDNENENSNIIYFMYKEYKFLFMGDASSKNEDNIVKKYNISDIDILKVGHHGSDTSSSLSFIEKINPKVSLISVGKDNIYGHPSKEVLKNLEDSKIYRTDLMGSILVKIKDDVLITTYSS